MAQMTQREMVLQYIKDNGSITSAEAYEHLGIMSMPKRICELEGEGHEFTKEIVKTKNRFGKKVRFLRYRLKV